MHKITYILGRIDDMQNMIPEYFHKDMRKIMFSWMTHNINNKYMQDGGGKRHKEDFIQHYKNYKLNIGVDQGDNDTIITIYTLDEKNPSACAIIHIMDNIASLSGLSHYKNCTSPIILAGKGGGTFILEFVLWFLKKNQEKYKIKMIVLEDISRKVCPDCDEQTHLATQYFLMYNNTWYGKYGFLPYDKIDRKPDKDKIKLYKKNRDIIKNAKVKDVQLFKYMKKAIIKHNIEGIDLSKLEQNIINLQDKPLSLVIRALNDTHTAFCCVFAYITKKIYTELKLYDFYKGDFYLVI